MHPNRPSTDRTMCCMMVFPNWLDKCGWLSGTFPVPSLLVHNHAHLSSLHLHSTLDVTRAREDSGLSPLKSSYTGQPDNKAKRVCNMLEKVLCFLAHSYDLLGQKFV